MWNPLNRAVCARGVVVLVLAVIGLVGRGECDEPAGREVAAKRRPVPTPAPAPKVIDSTKFDNSVLALATTHWTFLPQRIGTTHEQLLARELVRQSMLIAARHEMGLPAYDEVVSGPVDREVFVWGMPLAPGKKYMANTKRFGPVAFHAGSGQWPPFKMWRLAPRAQYRTAHVAFQSKKFPPMTITDFVDYGALPFEAEALSRGMMIEALVQMSFKRGKGNRVVDSGAVSAEVEKLLAEPEMVAQFLAVRKLHEAIAADGESPERLMALSRGYSNLGVLTACFWSSSSAAFSARGILYAQRVWHRLEQPTRPLPRSSKRSSALSQAFSCARWLKSLGKPKSPAAARARAYAMALAGLHRLALSDLDRLAKTATAGDAPAAANAGWVDLIGPYCRYDDRALEAMGKGKGTYARWATLLRLLTLEYEPADGVVLAAGRDVLKVVPNSVRALDILAGRFYRDSELKMSSRALEVFMTDLPDRLSRVSDLPAEAKAVLKVIRARTDVDLRPIRHVGEKLMAAGEIGTDTSVPSWAALGWMVREATFALTFRRFQFHHTCDGRATKDVVEDSTKLAGLAYAHPWSYLRWVYLQRREPVRVHYILSRMEFRDASLPKYHMLDGNLVTPYDRIWAGAVDVREFQPEPPADVGTAGGLELKLRHLPPALRGLMSSESKRLLGVSPYNPYAARVRLRTGALSQYTKPERGRATLGHRASHWRGVVEYYTINRQWSQALDALKQYTKISPDAWALSMAADAHAEQRKVDQCNATLARAAELKGPMSAESARLHARMARHWMLRGKYGLAVAPARVAIKAGIVHARLLLARSLARTGRLDEAEKLMRDAAMRQGFTHAYHYYLWRHRIGHGDDVEADQLVQQSFRKNLVQYVRDGGGGVDPNASGTSLEYLRLTTEFRPETVYMLLNGQKKQARDLLLIGQQKQARDARMKVVPLRAVDGLLAVLLLDEAGQTAQRDALLAKLIVQTSQYTAMVDRERLLQALAWLMQEDLIRKPPGGLDLVSVEACIRDADPELRPLMAYYVARYLKQHEGSEAMYVHYLKRAVGAINYGWGAQTLAAVELRKCGHDPMALTVPQPRPPAVGKRVDEIVIEAPIRSEAMLHVTPRGVYWTNARGVERNRQAPALAWVNGKECRPRWGRPKPSMWEQFSTGWAINAAPVQFKLAEYTISKARHGRHEAKLGTCSVHRNFGELIVKCESGTPGMWYRIRLVRDAKAPDAAAFALLRGRRAADKSYSREPSSGDPVGTKRLYDLMKSGGTIEKVKKLLLDHPKIDLDQRAKASSPAWPARTPLTVAKTAEIAKLLLDKGANVNARSSNLRTALHYAAMEPEGAGVVKLLIQRGADVNAVSRFSNTPLHKAATAETTKLLLDSGAKADVPGYKGLTPLYTAKTVEMAKLLLDAGADLKARSTESYTPLHWVIRCNNMEVTKLLIQRGADVNAKGAEDRTPLHMVAMINRPKTAALAVVVKMLVARKANLKARDKKGRTPLDYTAHNLRVRAVLKKYYPRRR